MLRTFRAFLWMRWRVLVNSLERTGARDTLDRFSIAVEKLGPIMALLMLIPSSIALFVLGLTAGFGVATGSWGLPMEGVRYFLLLVLGLTVIGPVVLPTRDGGSAVRLLLLPISRLTLYTAQVAGALADPWIALTVPVLLGVPIGLAVGLAFLPAAIALLAGVALLIFIAGLTSLASSVIHLLLRDRRRGDLVMLVVILVLPMIGILPQFLIHPEPRGKYLTRAERAALPPSRFAMGATRLAPYVPSETYRRATLAGRAAPIEAARPLAALALVALTMQAAGFAAFRRVLDMPVSLGTRRAGSFGGLWDRVIPGLSPAASAVALTQLRLALRSPRGRAIIGTPLVVPLIFAALAYSRGGDLRIPFLSANSGLGLATFGCALAVLALIPIAMNQFAIDKAGFTRQMLTPLTIGQLLAGKAVGNALIAMIPAIVCFILAALIFPDGPLSLWIALPIGAIATYALWSPAAAALSALFPKVVDLNTIGHSGNAHQAAGLLGMLALIASAAPAVLIMLLGTALLHQPRLVPVFLLVWCGIAFALSYGLFIPVRRLVSSRCETLAQFY